MGASGPSWTPLADGFIPMRIVDGVLQGNDGDWVESVTARVEHADGRLEIIAWAQHLRAVPVPVAAPQSATA